MDAERRSATHDDPVEHAARAEPAAPANGQADRTSRSTSRSTTRGPARGLAWLALIISALLEIVWATALASWEGLTQPWPVVVFLVAAVASLLGLAYALRIVRAVPAYVVWGIISAVVTAAWAFLGGVATFTTVSVVIVVILIGLAVGLQQHRRNRALATS